jgi:hypothetical protein
MVEDLLIVSQEKSSNDNSVKQAAKRNSNTSKSPATMSFHSPDTVMNNHDSKTEGADHRDKDTDRRGRSQRYLEQPSTRPVVGKKSYRDDSDDI